MSKIIALLKSTHFGVADAMLLGVAILWGTSYGVAKEVVVLYPVLGFLAIRFCMTALLLSPCFFRMDRASIVASLSAGLPLGAILLSIFIAETYGIAFTSASNAAFLISTCVVMTPLVERVVLGTRLTRNVLLAITCSCIGAFLISLHGPVALGFGDILILIAAFLRACMVTYTKRNTLDTRISTTALTAVQTAVVGLGSLGLAFVVLPNGLPSLPTEIAFWGGTVYLIIFCTIFAFFAQNYAVRKTTPTRVSLMMGTEPVFGAIFAVLWLGEATTILTWVGGLMIVFASFWGVVKQDGD